MLTSYSNSLSTLFESSLMQALVGAVTLGGLGVRGLTPAFDSASPAFHSSCTIAQTHSEVYPFVFFFLQNLSNK